MKPVLSIPWVHSLVFCFSIAPSLVAAPFDTQATTLPTAAAEPSAVETTEVRLTGITSISGNKRVMLAIREPKEPGQILRRQYHCTLSEGQSSGPVEVLSIDAVEGRVKIRNGEAESELTFARNGVEVTAPAPPSSQESIPARVQAAVAATYAAQPTVVQIWNAPTIVSAPALAAPVYYYAEPPSSGSSLVVINQGFNSQGRSFARHSYGFGSYRSYGSYSPGYHRYGYSGRNYGAHYRPASYADCRPVRSYCDSGSRYSGSGSHRRSARCN